MKKCFFKRGCFGCGGISYIEGNNGYAGAGCVFVDCINSAISWWYGVTSVRRYRERRAAGCKTKIIARNNHFV